jgi:hypothetical protein
MSMTNVQPFVLRIVAVLAALFGVLTVKAGGTVLFGGAEARGAAGHYVPFVLWFNFLAGFAYIVAGTGLWLAQRWAVALSVLIAGATAIVFAGFGLHVLAGGAFEMRTVWAMTVRTVVWIVFALVAVRLKSGSVPDY